MGARRLLLPLLALMAGVPACGKEPPRAGKHTVAIRNFLYAPATLQVAVGDTVVWVNGDVVPHTATAADGAWDTGSIAAGDSARVVVAKAGKQAYRCAFHPNMKAELTAR